MKPSGPVAGAFLFAAVCGLAHSEIIITASLDATGGVRIEWPTVPGLAYRILTVTNVDDEWEPLHGQPTRLVAATDSLSQLVEAEDPARFFRVVQLDADPLIWIPPGTFTMGSPSWEGGRDGDEGPQTQVTLTKGFFMARYEVTQEEYLAVTGSNPSNWKGDLERPVEFVNWDDATYYCGLLTQQERAAGRLPSGWEYRLPTEAQWEYACRAGTTTPFGIGNGTGLSSTQANFDGNYPYGGVAIGPDLERTTTVGSYLPNAWGLHDMHGNVWEWCLDWYADSLPGGSVSDPPGPTSGSRRVLRGGSWIHDGRDCRSASRDPINPGYTNWACGFRVALVEVQ